MTSDVVSVGKHTAVSEIAELLRHHRFGAVPVVDDARRVHGIVTEGDLVRRVRLMAAPRHLAWWQTQPDDRIEIARQYMKALGLTASDAMTAPVVTVTTETSLARIALLFERDRIKRAPVVRDQVLIGIVARRDLLQALLTDHA